MSQKFVLALLAALPLCAGAQVPVWQSPAPAPPRSTAAQAPPNSPAGSPPSAARPGTWTAPGTQPGAIAPGSLTPNASAPGVAAPGSLAPGALNSAAGNSAGGATASWNSGQTWSMPGKPPLTAASGAIDPVAAVRLRAAGLDPADPNFAAHLNDRMAKLAAPAGMVLNPGAGLAGRAGVAASHMADTARTNLIAKLRSAPTSATGAFYGAANAPPSESLRMPGALGQSQPLVTTGLFTGLVVQPVSNPVVIPMVYGLTFMAPAGVILPTQKNTAGLVHFSIPDCRAESDAFASVIQRNSPNISGFASQLPLTQTGTGVAFFMMLDDASHGSAWTMPLGASPHSGALTFHYGNYAATLNLQFSEGVYLPESHALSVGSNPPLLASGNDMGLKDSAFALQAPTVQRFNATHTPMTGTDIIGLGTQLGPSYGVSAQVIASHSVADVGGDSSADNQYRGATVSTQPGAGRFETLVNWHIGPGDSLQYTIQWTFNGAFGQRPLLTMPLRGSCDS